MTTERRRPMATAGGAMAAIARSLLGLSVAGSAQPGLRDQRRPSATSSMRSRVRHQRVIRGRPCSAWRPGKRWQLSPSQARPSPGV